MLRQAATQEAPPAVDVLFDVFEFALSPAGFGTVIGLIALGFIWDLVTASNNRTLLGQKRQTSVTLLGQTYDTDVVEAPSRFTIKFSCSDDGFYESLSGGAERVEAGVAYIEEFDELSSCVALGKALQRRFGKGRLQFQIYEVRGGDWTERTASSYTPSPRAGGVGKADAPAAGPSGGEVEVPRDGVGEESRPNGDDSVDREWKAIMESSKLLKRKDVGLDGVEMTVISGENACPLCNGRGSRGCSTCATPANLPGGDGSTSRLAGWLQGPDPPTGSCPTCSGSKQVPCEWCRGTGVRAKQ